MTVRMTESDVIELVGAVAAGGVVLVVLLTVLCIYLLVRPPRRRREVPPPDAADAVDAEEMLALMERMERRLATLERAIEPEAAPARIEESGAARPATRRKI